MFPAVDISKYQGAWQDYPADIVLIKMSGGDQGLYVDPDAATNYTDAKAAGKHVGGYHFVGWVLGAVQEAAWFVRAMAPKAENDVYELDVENGVNDIPASGPAYVMDMVNYIHSQTGVYPIIYMNLSTYNAFDWSEPLALCGLHLADWNNDPSGTISINHTYILQQYNDGQTGQAYDHDEYYGPSLASFDDYGYHASNDPTIVASPPTTTTEATTQAPDPTITTTTTEAPNTPDPSPTTTTTEVVVTPPFTTAPTTSTTSTTTTSTTVRPSEPETWLEIVWAQIVVILNRLRGVK